ncbi:MAG: S9 family peptidase, partial [Actinomycetes bacterium]
MVANLFASPAEFVTIPRLGGLLLSPDGTRLVATIAETDRKGAAYVNAVWAIDQGGQKPARRLTRSSEGESAVAFLPDGSLLFTSRRPRPDADRG